MDKTRLTETQFQRLVALTSMRKHSSTHQALYQHLVLGYSKREVCEAVKLQQPTFSIGLARLREADEAARAYAESMGYKAPPGQIII